ncbi:unnamed protein product [Dovyalis caffra]|uniref:Uncharacterized protein n=1 Tax=Dovyalis caffra TaxID=77055 RepID=A0AAV1SDD2_9ROSI|nr:unnamed protein product [Dovyalis caffra]
MDHGCIVKITTSHSGASCLEEKDHPDLLVATQIIPPNKSQQRVMLSVWMFLLVATTDSATSHSDSRGNKSIAQIMADLKAIIGKLVDKMNSTNLELK